MIAHLQICRWWYVWLTHNFMVFNIISLPKSSKLKRKFISTEKYSSKQKKNYIKTEKNSWNFQLVLQGQNYCHIFKVGTCVSMTQIRPCLRRNFFGKPRGTQKTVKSQMLSEPLLRVSFNVYILVLRVKTIRLMCCTWYFVTLSGFHPTTEKILLCLDDFLQSENLRASKNCHRVAPIIVAWYLNTCKVSRGGPVVRFGCGKQHLIAFFL